ncbi:MAG TPA: helix-turn-helix transcriptional regulator [Acidobacteriaceae bacterium]|nr:helix-turn-helix transcriptional regulator [Acidobacteriaceae bacterium]
MSVGQFGDELRKEREARGVALETISEKTKVIARYLSALETEHFEVLPGGILSKGIVRGYVRTIGLDETAWMERFLIASREHGTPIEDGWTSFAENVGRARRASAARTRRFRWTGLGVLLLLLTGLGFFVFQYLSGHVMADETQRHPATSASYVAPPPDAPTR